MMAAAVQRPEPGWGHWHAPIHTSNGQEATAALIDGKGIGRVEASDFPPPVVPSNDAKARLMKLTVRQYDGLGRRLAAVFRGAYKDEDAFDKKLFGKLRDTYPRRIDVNANSFIPYRPRDDETRAIGFARQVTKKVLGIRSDWGGTRNNRHDHCVVVFSREHTAVAGPGGSRRQRRRTALVTGPWKITYCLSTVELKMNDTTPLVDEDMSPDLDESAGGLGQAIIFTLVDVWTCLNLFNSVPSMEVNESVLLPVTVVAARRREKQNTCLQRSSSVCAELVVPVHCGEAFYYTVRSYRRFQDANQANQAADDYLSHLCWGLARCPVDANGNVSIRVERKPLSGVRLPDAFHNANRLAYSLPMTPDPGHVGGSQGDLWRWRGSYQQLQTALPHSEAQEVWRSDIAGTDAAVQQDLVIKISVRAVHPQIVEPSKVEKAMDVLSTTGGIARIEDVFVGMVLPDCTITVTIMKDMRALGYIFLQPNSSGKTLADLWTSFGQLVTAKLVPLAERGIVHCDLRAGSDWVQNILVDATRGDMVLIDFESLVLVRDLPRIEGEGKKRYIVLRKRRKPQIRQMAMEFVWWQVFLLGVSWARVIDANDVDFRRVSQNVRQDGSAGYSPVPEDASFQANAASINRIVAYFQNHFAGNDLREAEMTAAWP